MGRAPVRSILLSLPPIPSHAAVLLPSVLLPASLRARRQYTQVLRSARSSRPPFVSMAMTFVDRSVGGLADVARGAHGDWILTSRASVNDLRFAERCYANALFTLPGMVPGRPDLALLPNPVERYCIDFSQQVNWSQGQKMRAGRRRRFRFSMDRDFAGSLAKLRAFHSAGKDGTWFDDALFAMILRAHRRQRMLDESGGEGAKSGASPSSATNGPQAATALPIVRHHVFELWDAETGELLAVTAGFACGRAYHDYSMACLVRDNRSAGQ